MVISRVTHGSASCQPGRFGAAGSSQCSLPWSTSMASEAVVNALLEEPMAKRVFSSARADFPTSSTPYPLAKITESFLTIARATAGAFQSTRTFST